ncbi:hypothetical protein CBR_g50954 [Chara braunii]|uniref:Myb-like domain-containing protein n=1 Tax=Chara braunii TaxID=69332 RepID=A0A388M7T8_CHABU|nr:hypothetical protein CBR_g50954 [Chara braunii]|eukprot:GBG90610.1 hypothetical protein CBR_g50954 [Chara braunii]
MSGSTATLQRGGVVTQVTNLDAMNNAAGDMCRLLTLPILLDQWRRGVAMQRPRRGSGKMLAMCLPRRCSSNHLHLPPPREPGQAHGRLAADVAILQPQRPRRHRPEAARMEALSCRARMQEAFVAGQREDDALMADASSVHKLKKHGERREWIARRMRDEGWNRSAEDCRKKWFALGQKLKVLADKVGRSGKPGYFDMIVEEREAEGLYANFDRRLWAEMDWILQKPSGTCDNTLYSDSLNAKDWDNSARGSSDRGGSDQERSDGNASAGKTRRTFSGRVNDGDGPSSMSGMSVALAESTRVYVDGLDRAATMIAEAQTAGATMVAGRLGDMATQIGAVAIAMIEGNAVLQLLVGVMASRGPRGPNSPREARGGRDNDPSSL